MKHRTLFCLFIGLATIVSFFEKSFSQDTTAFLFGSRVNKTDLINYMSVLTADSLEGRETGKAGQKKAAAFISKHFSSLGLKPISQGRHLQQHPISVRSNRGKNIEVNQKSFLFMKDYFFLPGYNDTLIVLDTILFAGYGVSESRYDDYASLNVKGRAILFFDGHPKEKKIDLSAWSHDWNKKQNIIGQKQPSVAFIVADSIDKIIDSLNNVVQTTLSHTSDSKGPGTPIVFITHEMARAFFPEHEDDDLDDAKSYIDRKNKPHSFPVSTSAFVHLINNTEELMGENVVGYLEGTDKKDEVSPWIEAFVNARLWIENEN